MVKATAGQRDLRREHYVPLHTGRRGFEWCAGKYSAWRRARGHRIGRIKFLVLRRVAERLNRRWGTRVCRLVVRSSAGFSRLSRARRCRLRCRSRRGRRVNSEWLKRLAVEFAVNLQSVANLVTTNGCGQIRIRFTIDFAVVEALILQQLLHMLNQLIGSCQQRQCNKDQSSDLDFHSDLILTLGRFAYSVLSRTVAATVDLRWRAASR